MAVSRSRSGDASGKIVLHEKAFAHLTRGMYRSPASAIRELVSNAWDANASVVNIRTGYPHFVELSVTDNGDGFDRDEFVRIVAGGLGNSEKRERHLKSKSTRPPIGRLGVGMFGIAQVCASFVISSNPKRGKPFKARVKLYSLLQELLDKPDSPIMRRRTDADGDGPPLEMDIGEYELLEFDPEEFDTTGTRIIADVMHPVFTMTFRESIKLEDGVPRRDWKEAVTKQLAKHHSLQEQGEYFRLMWEIAASAPVPYIDEAAVPEGCVKDFQRQLLAARFKVVVDGIEMRKPVWLRGNPNGYTTIKIPTKTDRPFNRTITFSGYIAVQEGKQLRPDELRGLMIRVKGVGIGLYDPSLLDYRFNEGPRTRWITGEIYVSEGLEDALNVDRDSFNRFHPQYRFLQKTIHELLREKLFPVVYTEIKRRSTRKARAKKLSRSQAFIGAVEETFGAKTKTTSTATEQSIVVQAITINNSTKKVSLSLPEEGAMDTKKGNRELASRILGLLDLAMLQSTKTEMRRSFEEALLKLLRDW